MRTGDEPIAGGIAWTAFPANPRVPPIFPLRTGKHHAGVAELVDALGLGSSRFICGGSSPLMSTK